MKLENRKKGIAIIIVYRIPNALMSGIYTSRAQQNRKEK